MRKESCSVEELRATFRYDESGKLFWLSSGIGRKPSLEAGSYHKATNCFKVAFKRKQYALHRVIWALVYGEWPDKEVDHIDGDETNNKVENLRLATGKQNCVNRGSRKGSTSKYRGVYKSQSSGKWCACINKDHLGTFNSEEEAALAYNLAAAERYKEFAKLNKIGD